MVFRGRFFCKLDVKGRLSLPSAYGFKKSKVQNQFVITNSKTKDQRFLDVYLLKEWEALEKKVLKWPALDKNVQAFQRFYMSSAQTVDMDTQGRFLIPQGLRQYAHLKEATEVVLVGMGHKIEIWNANDWEKLFSKIELNFEDLLEEVIQHQNKKE